MRTLSQRKQGKVGEWVVDGLLAGLGAGVVMIGFLLLVGWMFGEPAFSMLGRFSLGGGALRGLLLHLGVSSFYGIIFSMILHLMVYLGEWLKSPMLTMLAGLIYGSFLWLFSGMILLALQVSPFATLPQPTFAIAHLIYGVSLGMLAQRHSEMQPEK